MPSLAAFHVLAEPNRQAILDYLQDGERPVGDLVAHLRLSRPAVSKHLRVLKDAGLVAARVDGQRRLYRVRPEPLQALDAWLEPYRIFWTARLDQLESHLNQSREPVACRRKGNRCVKPQPHTTEVKPQSASNVSSPTHPCEFGKH